MTEEDVCRYIVKNCGICIDISCDGVSGLNSGLPCPIRKICQWPYKISQAKNWLDKYMERYDDRRKIL